MTNKTLIELSPQEIVDLCRDDLALSQVVLNDETLLNKLGCHKAQGKLFGSSYFWKSFNTELDKYPLLSEGFYLFEFIKINRKVYELALERKITDRLSSYQRDALENYFYNENDYQFYKKNTL